jgi:ABC-type lipoprotein release transport system permease subunit
MRDDLVFAWRNVWRNTRRSVVTIAALSLALFMMIVYTGLMTGNLNGLEANILDLEVGDAQAYADGYREKPSLYTTIADPEPLIHELEQAGFSVSGRLLGAGLGAGADSSAGVQLIGIDVERDARVTKISQHLRDGVWLQPDDEGVVLGRQLSKNLALAVGDELVVLSQGADGSMANDVYPVRGVLDGISQSIDHAGVFMTDAEFRELMVLPAGVHQLILRKPGETSLDDATAAANALAPDGVQVSSWKQLMPTLASMLENAGGSLKFMSAIVYLAVGIVLLNAMLMAVFERIRELGVLKAIGFTPVKVWSLIMLETAIQTGVAAVVGVVLAIPTNHYLVTRGLDLSALGNISIMGMAWDPIWRAEVDTSTYVGPLQTMLVIVFLSVLYPALRAAFIRPLDAIRD